MSDNSIGKVINASFNYFQFKSNKNILSDSFVITQIGKLRFLLGRVIDVSINPENERIYTVNVLNIVSIINKEFKFDNPREPAIYGSDVVLPSSTLIASALGLSSDYAAGIYIGSFDSERVCLRTSVLARHVFIGGVTGSGKSNLGNIMIKEFSRLRIPSIIIDTQKDYIEATRKLGGSVLVPGIDFSVPISTLSSEEVLYIAEGLRGSKGYPVFIFAFNKLKRKANKSSDHYFSLDQLLEVIKKEAIETFKLPAIEYNTAMAIIEASVQEYLFFKPSISSINLIKLVNSKGPSVIDCSEIDTQQTQIVTTCLIRELYDLVKQKKIPSYSLIIDEAHLFLSDNSNPICKSVLAENIKIGRHYGIKIVLITQNPLDIDKKSLSQCGTRILFCTEEDQLKALHGIRSDITKSMLDNLPKLPVGTCILFGNYETIRHAIVVNVPENT